MKTRMPWSSYHNGMFVHHDYPKDPHAWASWTPVLNPGIDEFAEYIHTTDRDGEHIHLGCIGKRDSGQIRTVYWTYVNPCPDTER